MSFLKEYTLLGELGKGGFAKVYKVRHNELGYIRAIRVLNESIADEHVKTYQKFLHECKVLLRLGNGNHRNIVHIYQPRLLDNHALVEMDYVDGQDITHYLKENGNFLPIEEVLRMVEEMSNALAYCHEDIYQFCMDPDEDDLQNDPVDGSKWLIDEDTKKKLIEKYKVIHNDIHSGNIMRRKDGSFVLLDFGLAIEGDEVVKSSSRHENGAPEYMPPEKWDNEAILTEQSDIYSMGVVMYEYLAGRVPFVCEGNSFNARKKLYEEIKNSTSLPSIFNLRKTYFEEKNTGKTYQKDYPDWLETAILKCLEKDPTRRFSNGKDLFVFISKHLQADVITKETVQKLTDEIDSLKDERQNAVSQIAALTQKNSELAKLADSLAEDLEQTRKEIEKQKGFQEERLNRELGVLQDRIKQKDTEIQSLQDDVRGLENLVAKAGEGLGSHEQLENQLEKLYSQCEDLEKQLNQTRLDKKTLEDQVEKLKTKSGSKVLCVLLGIAIVVFGILYFAKAHETPGIRIPEDYASMKAEIDSLKHSNEALEEQKKGLFEEIDQLKNATPGTPSGENDLENQLAQANADKIALEKQISELNSKIEKLKNIRQGSSSRENDLEKQLAQANTDKSALEKQVTDLKAEIVNLKKASTAPSSREKELEKERNNLKTVRDNLMNQNSELRKEISALHKEISALQENCF